MDTYKADFSSKLNSLIRADKMQEAKALLKQELKSYPDEYYLLTCLAQVYFNLKKHKKALNFAEKAMEIEPNDVLVVYDYACVLSGLDKNQEAIVQWDKIIEKDINEVAYGEFGEGLKWAKSIINDSRVRKAVCCLEIEDKPQALRLLNLHLENRQRGIYSDFKKKVVEKMLKTARPG